MITVKKLEPTFPTINMALPDKEYVKPSPFPINIISKTCQRIITFIPIRAWIVSLLVISVITMQMNRVNISLAVVVMTINEDPETGVNSSLSTDLCPLTMDDDWLEFNLPTHANVTIENIDEDTLEVFYKDESPRLRLRDKVYAWSASTQSWIYGAYYWSYFLCMIPGGLYATRMGSKVSIAGGLLLSSLVNVSIPLITEHIIAFIILRMIIGISHGAILPSAIGVVARWIPIEEQSICFPLIEMSMYGGSMITFGIAGWVNDEFGWPGLFVVPGIIAVMVSIPDLLFLKDNPPSSSPEGGGKPSVEVGRKAPSEASSNDSNPPIMDILLNVPVLSCAMLKLSRIWNVTVIQGNIPMYLERVAHKDVSENGYTNAGMYACMVSGLLLSGSVAGYLVNNNIMSRTRCRKLMSLVVGVGGASTMFLIPAAGCNSPALHVMLFLNSFCCGFYGGSDSPLPVEMSERYPSFVYALINMMSLISYLVEPVYAGFILDHVEDKWMAWCTVFWTGGFLSLFANVVFLLGASTDRQPFDYHEEERKAATKKSFPS